MARRTFFSFHYDGDVWRANQVRMANVVLGTDGAGFFDHSEYEDAKRMGALGIQRMILRHLENTSVTVVLIGRSTAFRPWVQYEIAESIKRKNGLLGIYIYHLQDPNQRDPVSLLGQMVPPPKPLVPSHIAFPAYNWDSQKVAVFAQLIEGAGQRADRMRQPLPPGLGFFRPR